MGSTYKALYRTYRPRRFEDVVGQDHATAILRNAVKGGRLAHAYLLSGPRGIGKTTLARILAMAANCERQENGEPCLTCTACSDPALHTVEIDAASNRGIDEIRDLRERARFLPAIGTRKVYIVDEAHMLTQEAFNALLKTLEEPPEHLLFLLATTEAERMPETVLSRCQRIHLRRLDEGEILGRLGAVARDAGIAAQDDALRFLARKAEGSLRDALALLDLASAFNPEGVRLEDAVTALGAVPDDRLKALEARLFDGDGRGILALLDSLAREGVDFRQLTKDLLDDLRLVLLDAYAEDRAEVRGTGRARLLGLVKGLAELEITSRQGGDPRLLLEILLLGFAGANDDGGPVAQPPSEAETPGPPRGAPGAGTAALDLGALREHFRSQGKNHIATLLEGVTGEVTGGTVALVFESGGGYVRAGQDDMQRLLREGLAHLLGRPVDLEIAMKTREG